MESENKSEKWRMLVKEFEESNQSRKVWCTEKKIKPHVLGYWFSLYGGTSKNKNKQIENVENFTQISSKNETLSTSNWLEIQLPKEENKSDISTQKTINIKIGKVEISISSGFDKGLFKEVVKVLGEI